MFSNQNHRCSYFSSITLNSLQDKASSQAPLSGKDPSFQSCLVKNIPIRLFEKGKKELLLLFN